jgi:homoserine kinase type II
VRLIDALPEIARDFNLGAVHSATPLTGGGADVIKVVTDRGAVVVKPSYRRWEAELYDSVQQRLNARGVRQARLYRSATGSAVSRSGHTVQEWLDGAIAAQPTPRQSKALFEHLADYDAGLAAIPAPDELRRADSVFVRVASPEYLLSELTELFDDVAPPGLAAAPVQASLTRLAAALPAMNRLRKQIVHGDVAPDNVLYRGDEVVAVIDFTPHCAPALFSLATALYWYHAHPGASSSQLSLAVSAYSRRRPLTPEETRLWPAALVLQGLRRLATPLALAQESGQPPTASVVSRHRAVAAILSVV